MLPGQPLSCHLANKEYAQFISPHISNVNIYKGVPFITFINTNKSNYPQPTYAIGHTTLKLGRDMMELPMC